MAAIDPTAPEQSRFSVQPQQPSWIGVVSFGLIVVAVVLCIGLWPARVSRKPSATNSSANGGGVDSIDKNAFLIHLSESERSEYLKVAFERQTEEQQIFSAIWALESEVNNGGFNQYFFNQDPDIIAHAPAALRAIGAKGCAEIVEQAIQVIAPLPSTQDGRYTALESLSDDAHARLSALDSEFCKYPDNLTELLFDFVSRHPETFGPASRPKSP